MRLPAFPELVLAVRTLSALVFLFAAQGKLRHRAIFQGVVANYRLLPEFLAAPAALLLPPVEAALGVMLLLGLGSPWSEAGAAAMLLLFGGAMGINIARGRSDIDCGCFQSTLKQPLNWALVARNVALALALVLTAASVPAPLESWSRVEGFVAGVVAFLILQSLNILWSIVPAWRRPPRLGMGVR